MISVSEFEEKIVDLVTKIYNKHIFGSNDLEDEQKEAIMDFVNDLSFAFDDFFSSLN